MFDQYYWINVSPILLDIASLGLSESSQFGQ